MGKGNLQTLAGEAPPPSAEAHPAELTLRAILTGMVLGALLSLCNLYSGLKIGWGVNMSVTAGLLSYAFWQSLHTVCHSRRWGLLENNINQTTASSAASIAAAGLVGPIPALTMLTGQTLRWPLLALWLFAVSLVGVMVAIGLRRQLLLVDRLPFPGGIATAETLQEMHAHGGEALARVRMLVTGGLLAAGIKVVQVVLRVPLLEVPLRWTTREGGLLRSLGHTSISMKNLSFGLDPSLLMVGVGALIGLRVCVSVLLGAVIAWGVLGPLALHHGWVDASLLAPDRSWYGQLVKWLVWPGVALMVSASLASLAFSWRSFLKVFARGESVEQGGSVSRRWFLVGCLAAVVLAAGCQHALFSVPLGVAVGAVFLTLFLAVTAARVAGETGISPVGPMGKVTQFVLGIVAPGDAASNLMAANVTGGAASQCGDLMHDLKAGLLLGASPGKQAIAQLFGVMTGATVGAAAYLLLVPDPASMLLTEEWPAPAVAAWKTVAEIFATGLEAMPPGALVAMAWATVAGCLLSVLERLAPPRHRKWVPSATSIGLAMVVPAATAISIFIGGVAAAVAGRWAPRWSARFMVVLAAGIIAGESLAGVGLALSRILFP